MTQTSVHTIQLNVPDMHCAGCMGKVERSLTALPDVISARVNLSTRRVRIAWANDELSTDSFIHELTRNGFPAEVLDDEVDLDVADGVRGKDLLIRLAVAGFAAGNVMLLSVSVWSGAADATREMFHWISALVAMPAILFAGQPFFRSAFAVLKHGRANMDVPISLSVLLAGAMSFYETMIGRQDTYFDAALTLLFFLLAGRYLDHMMRARAGTAARQLLKRSPKTALLETADGQRHNVPVATLNTGQSVVVLPGTIVPVDGKISNGTSELDNSILTGESMPAVVRPDDLVYSGALNLSSPLTLTVTAVGEESFLANVIRLMETAEQHKSRYVRIADRLATWYTPFVHAVALVTFIGWFMATNGDWHQALIAAIAVLVITCPCALGLAVPVVHVVANGVLFSRGILVKDGAALEKLAAVNSVILDKTGTVTTGQLQATNIDDITEPLLAYAAGLAQNSTHPLSRALTAAVQARNIRPREIQEIVETPGQGLKGLCQGQQVLLGNASWCGLEDNEVTVEGSGAKSELWLRVGDMPGIRFTFEDQLRTDARATVSGWMQDHMKLTLLSGDRENYVAAVAKDIAIPEHISLASPEDKVNHIRAQTDTGYKVLMIGDGINDAPALAAAHVSMAPAGASDIGRAAADFIFLGDRLAPAAYARKIAVRARALIRQNFALALIYNMFAIPIAMAGFASPMVAAIAMSTSSLIVTLNALRLRAEQASNKTIEESSA